MQELARRVESGEGVSLRGVSCAAQPFVATLLARLARRPVVLVTEGLKSQELAMQDVQTWLSLAVPAAASRSRTASTLHPQPLFYPAWEILPHEERLPHTDVLSERLETLIALARCREAGPAPVIVTTSVALQQRTFAPDALGKRVKTLKRGDRIDPLDLIEWLEAQGYEPEAQVTQKGELALRGGIVDVYPLSSPWPVRLEFFGDELDSLRYFEPHSQLSREQIEEAVIPPAGELNLFRKAAGESGGRRGTKKAAKSPAEAVSAIPLGSLHDHLPSDALFLFCEPEQLEEAAASYTAQLPGPTPFVLDWIVITEVLKEKVRIIEVTEALEPPVPGEKPVTLDLGGLDAFRPLGERPPEPQIAEARRREFFAQLHRWLRQDFAVHVFCNNEGERDRLKEIWADYGFAEGGKKRFQPKIEIGAIARGFLSESARVAIVTDAEIFGRYKVQRPRRMKSPHAVAVRSAFDIDFTELDPGDLVVHVQHGIGQYLGLQVLPSSTAQWSGEAVPPEAGQECLVIEYRAADRDHTPPRLYVPVTQAHLVSKYVGAGKANPKLSRLGGARWQKTKKEAEQSVRDFAGELLAIQAARDSQPGHPFNPDTRWQKEFEDSFIYEETPHQITAIGDIKSDMERPRPMDRLICGDVGFGKTEVAIRAAFKAVMDGKQVAVLVPTTVLAQQHYKTFIERTADYPVKVDLLSRFRTRREQDLVIRDLKRGAVDIVIGTHRLVQSDIEFKDLGLVIIDEEQRFGVAHKEQFKRMRMMVEVLTLSATPIPRTLYLSLTGARDMSVIETPPQDRLPVETIVAAYDERIMREAIRRELNRGGQVYFLHNRVQTIHGFANKLHELVPQARIVVGHGQMPGDQLEEVMTTFINGEADVLLSTTIIESGIDIPNANTIIIDRADRFGLSDLYQLRGRVGRYKHQAYAYLMIPRHSMLVKDARKRMNAIRQFSALGSGFKIAMRDLEIRGAGNLLGAEQSGHITAVGFELYCQLLKQSISSLKGEEVKPRIDVTVRIDFLAMNPGEKESGDGARTACYIPFQYIGQSQQRIEIYRRLAQATETSALDRIEEELRDRYGPLPETMQLLLQVGRLKIFAAEKKVTVIETRGDKIMLQRNNDYIRAGTWFPRMTKKSPGARLNEIRRFLMAL